MDARVLRESGEKGLLVLVKKNQVAIAVTRGPSGSV